MDPRPPPPVEPSVLPPEVAVTMPVLAVPSLVIDDVADIDDVAVGSEVEPDPFEVPVPDIVIAPVVGVDVVLPPASVVPDTPVALVVPDAETAVVEVSFPQPLKIPHEAKKASPNVRRIVIPPQEELRGPTITHAARATRMFLPSAYARPRGPTEDRPSRGCGGVPPVSPPLAEPRGVRVRSGRSAVLPPQRT